MWLSRWFLLTGTRQRAISAHILLGMCPAPCQHHGKTQEEAAEYAPGGWTVSQGLLVLAEIIQGFSCGELLLLLFNHFSRVRLCATPRTAARQAPLSMGFSRQEYWSGLPCPPPGDLPDPGIEPRVSCVACRFLTAEPLWRAYTFLPDVAPRGF